MKMQFLKKNVLSQGLDPVPAAVFLHQWIVKVQPFTKRNCLMARVWMNVMLQLGGVEAISFPDKTSYRKAALSEPETLEAEIRKQILEKQ